MSLRTIQKITYAHEFQMGPMRVKQPLPAYGFKNVGPFILLQLSRQTGNSSIFQYNQGLVVNTFFHMDVRSKR